MGRGKLSSTNPGPVRAPIPIFSGFYRIVEPKCRIVVGFLVHRRGVFTSENHDFPMGEYRTVFPVDWKTGCGSGRLGEGEKGREIPGISSHPLQCAEFSHRVHE